MIESAFTPVFLQTVVRKVITNRSNCIETIPEVKHVKPVPVIKSQQHSELHLTVLKRFKNTAFIEDILTSGKFYFCY